MIMCCIIFIVMLSVIMMKVKCCEYGSCAILVLAQYELLYITSSMSLVIPLKFRFDLFKNGEIKKNATWHKCYKACINCIIFVVMLSVNVMKVEFCDYDSCSV